MCGPLSVEYMTMVFSTMPSSSSLRQHRADVLVVVDHHIVIGALPAARLPDALGLGMRAEMHVGEVHPDEERLARLVLSLDEVGGARGDVVVDRLHPLPGQRPGVLDRCVPICRSGLAMLWIDAARPEVLAERSELRVLRVVRQLRLFLGVEMVEIAVELVEAMRGRQELVLVAEMVLAELASRVALGLQELGDRRVLLAEADVGARQPDLAQARAQTLWPVMKAERPAVQLCSP